MKYVLKIYGVDHDNPYLKMEHFPTEEEMRAKMKEVRKGYLPEDNIEDYDENGLGIEDYVDGFKYWNYLDGTTVIRVEMEGIKW